MLERGLIFNLMFRLIIIVVFFLFSLLTLFPAPAMFLWYVAIIVTEYPWAFMAISLLLSVWAFRRARFKMPALTLSLAAFFLYAVPIIQALQVSGRLNDELAGAFTTTIQNDREPFSFFRMFSGEIKREPYQRLIFDPVHKLELDFYPTPLPGKRPCVVVVHGGSWKGGDSRQLPELNYVLARKGYHVASVNYRKAPECQSPAPVEDLYSALKYLRANGDISRIDTSKFVLLGRSAGGQIALLGAYTFKNMGIKGVISYYGPADMIWGYNNPAVIYNSCKVLEDYIGGTYDEFPNAYLASSPIEAVDSSTVPTLLVHGKNDVLVSYYHSPRLVERLNKYGVPNYLLTLPWATHGCDYALNGPSGQLATYAVERFLETVVR